MFTICSGVYFFAFPIPGSFHTSLSHFHWYRFRRADHDDLTLPSATKVMSQLRALLYNFQQEQQYAKNNVYDLIRFDKDKQGRTVVSLGPTFDKGLESEHFKFDSGARLSFGLSLQDGKDSSRLLAYRVQYVAPTGKHPSFIRFDLNKVVHETPLLEPMCHMHPGHDDIRLPSVVLEPVHVLELVLYVIESQFL
jgi:hypothetical protein